MQLPLNLFCRTHKSYIVALNKINGFSRTAVQIGTRELSLSKIGFEKISERLLDIDRKSAKEFNVIKKMSVEEYLKRYRKSSNGNESNSGFEGNNDIV